MAKRVLAWLMILAMLLSVIPNISLDVEAAETTTPGASEVCDHTSHDGTTWTTWNTATALPDGNVAGYYCLNTNVDISKGWDVYANIHLCLNGHSITQTGSNQRVINVKGGGELSIYDCTGKDTAIVTGGSGTSGAAVNVNRLGKLNLYGGTITGNGNTASGGAIYLSAANDDVHTGGMFNMYGGVIKGNSAKNGIVYVAGGKDGYTNTVFNMYGGAITGNSVTGNGGAILAKAYGIVNITNGMIAGNTTKEGAAVSVTDNGKLTVSGDTVIAGNTNAANTADVVLADKLYVNELTGGSNITIQTATTATDASQIIAVDGKQTETWQAGWVTYMKADGTEQDIGYITSGSGKAFAFGHYHGDQKYEAYAGGANHSAIRTLPGYYYLTNDILRSTTSSGHVSLNAGGTEQHLCLNGHSITHRNPAIRLYLVDSGDKLFIEDCTSYYNEKEEFVAGGIHYGGASDSTVKDGSAIQVTTGGQLTMENIKISGFVSTATNGSPLRVLGTAESRGVLNMTGVEITGNKAPSGGVLYANTGATVNMTACVIKNNEGIDSVGAIGTAGDAQVTITDTVITGNTTKSYGTVNVANPNVVLILAGATQLTGNTGGNLHLQKGEGYVANVDGLTQGAKVGVTLIGERITAGQMHFTTVITDGADPLPYCYSDSDSYKVRKKNGRLVLGAEHEHCLEGVEECSDHELVGFTPWKDATKLPETAGKYYLTTDVTVINRAALTNADLTLCLNGHTIQAADSYEKSRAFYLRGDAKLTLTDCTATPGKIIGFKATAIMCDTSCTDAVINLYHIAITGNSNTGTCAGVLLQGTSQLNLYSGEISNNTSADHAGGVYAGGKSTVNLIGGKITGNTAPNNGGGVYVDGRNVRINLSGTTVSGNTAKNGGGIYCQGGAHLEMTGGEISGNKATENGGGVMIYTNSSMTMTSGKVTGNTSDKYTAGVSVQTNASLELSGDAQITNNAAAGSFGGIYVHNLVEQVNISGDVQVTGNTAKNQTSNMYLAGTSTFVAGKLGEKGNVGISTGKYFRPVSTELAADCSASFFSDNKSYSVVYRDKTLYLDAVDGHAHCFCYGENEHCDHTTVKFAPWESATSLPSEGNYYLTTDVVLTNRAGLENTELNLCLNGHTIRVAEDYEKGRAFYLRGDTKLTITCCAEVPGMITGAKETAVMFDGNCVGAEYNMYNITMTGNNTTTGGGAVLVQGETTFNMYSGTLTGNTATTVLALDAEGKPALDADGNQVAKSNMGGGAIASSTVNSNINIYGGTITDNCALRLRYVKANGKTAYTGGSGGAIYAKGNVTIHDGVITGNVAESNGGGILVGGNETTLTILGGKITGNTGKAGGGVISQNRTSVIMNGGEISGNTGTVAGGVYVSINSKFTMNGGTIDGNTSSGDAGGMYVYASTVTLNAGSIKNNKAAGNGGGIGSNKGTATVNGEKVDKGVVIAIGKEFAVSGNYAKKNAGGIMLCGKTGQMTLEGGSITGNRADEAAGGVLTQNSCTFTMKSGKISGNVAKSSGGGVYVSTNTVFKMQGGSVSGNSTTKGTAGGVQLLRSEGIFSGGSITGNTSGGGGGGMYLSGATAKLCGTYIGSNTASTNGGGVGTGQASAKVNGATTKFQPKLVLSGSIIEKNKAKNGGGLILQSYTVFDIQSGEIRNNEASTNGGGIYASTNATVNMTGGSIHDNTATTSGSAVYHLNSTGNYTGIEFYNNQTLKFHGAFYLNSKSTCSFIDCKFYDNQAAEDGGAFYGAQNCKVTMENCTFTENTAGNNGGAILCRGNVSMTNCDVLGNTAAVSGGGISTGKCGIRGSKFQEGLVLTGVTVKDNTAGAQGGGLYLSAGCRTTMSDVAITGNKSAAEGGGFWAVDDTTLHNVTVTGNTSGGKGYAAWYDYSVFDGHSYFVGVHKISGDIIIEGNEGGDMYLGQEVAIAIGLEGLGDNAKMNITLDSGVLTNRLYGEYDYEGGNQVYTVTKGSRSLTEPEIDTAMVEAEQTEETNTGDILLYAGVGVFVAAILAVAVLLLAKKKKAGNTAAEVTSE